MRKHSTGLAPLPSNDQGPVCGVTAISNMTGEPFEKVWHILSLQYGKNWGGRTFSDDLEWAFTALGFTTHTRSPRFGISLGAFCENADFNTKYMVWTPGHVQVVHEGRVFDQYGSRFFTSALAAHKRVVLILTITGRTEVKASTNFSQFE